MLTTLLPGCWAPVLGKTQVGRWGALWPACRSVILSKAPQQILTWVRQELGKRQGHGLQQLHPHTVRLEQRDQGLTTQQLHFHQRTAQLRSFREFWVGSVQHGIELQR